MCTACGESNPASATDTCVVCCQPKVCLWFLHSLIIPNRSSPSTHTACPCCIEDDLCCSFCVTFITRELDSTNNEASVPSFVVPGEHEQRHWAHLTSGIATSGPLTSAPGDLSEQTQDTLPPVYPSAHVYEFLES